MDVEMTEETDSMSMIEPVTETESQSILGQEIEDSNSASTDKEDSPEPIEDSEVVDTETVSETVLKESNEDNKNAPVFNPKLTQLPLARIKHIMKMDPDVNMASQDAVFMVAKALELFIESLAVESFSYTSHSKKKTISRDDVFKAIDAVDALAFLDGALDS